MDTCFHILAVVNNAAMNMGAQTSFWGMILLPLGIYSEEELLNNMIVAFYFFFFFWETFILFATRAIPIYTPINNKWGFPFLYILTNTYYLSLFDNRNPKVRFIERTDAEAGAPILSPHDTKSKLIRKTLMLGKIEGRRRRDDRGWDGWVGSPTQWTWVWANSGSWWWTGKPGVLQSMGSQRVKHEWVSEQQMRWYFIVVLICISLRLVVLSIFSYNCWSFVCLFWKNVNSIHLSNF